MHSSSPNSPPTPSKFNYFTSHITQGNIDNNHIYITDGLRGELFPAECFGAPNRSNTGTPIRLDLMGFDEPVFTDIPTERSGEPRKIFRNRSWAAEFIKKHNLRPGDTVVFTQLSSFHFKVTPQRATPTIVSPLPPRTRNASLARAQFILPPIADAALFVARARDCQALPEANLAAFVKDLLMALGHSQGAITLEAGKIDILLRDDLANPIAVFEIKRELSTEGQIRKARRQAFDYALRVDARLVVLSNADVFHIYDRHLPGGYDDLLVGQFQLSRFTPQMIPALELLHKQRAAGLSTNADPAPG